jgi:prepilin-type N-terminal cleavage/methylation domain-containing protein
VSRPPPIPRGRRGFTLIEVLGALVIFAFGVLMVIQSSGALSTRMGYAARTSEVVVRAHEWVDSLEALSADSLAPGTRSDTVTVGGVPYRREAVVSRRTALRVDLTVSLTPVDGGGPGYTARSHAAASW